MQITCICKYYSLSDKHFCFRLSLKELNPTELHMRMKTDVVERLSLRKRTARMVSHYR